MLVTRGLITDDDAAQILAQEHSGFGAWVGEPFEEADRTKFVARYIERGPISLEKLTIQDDIITYTTKDERAHEFDAMEFLALLSCHNLSRRSLGGGGFRNHTNLSLDTTAGTRAGRGGRGKSANQFKTPLPLRSEGGHRSPGLSASSASMKSIRWRVHRSFSEGGSAHAAKMRCASSHSLLTSERYQRSLRHLGFPRRLHHPQYQELHNRSCSMKIPGMTSSKRWQRVACVCG